MSTIQKLILTQGITEKKEINDDGGSYSALVDITSDDAVTVIIEIKHDYSSANIQEALSKVFERAMQCWQGA